MLVKGVGYGVWSSRTGFTVNVFGSLAAASRVRSGGETADRVTLVMSSSRTISREMVVSCQPANPAVEVPLLELLADVVDGDVLRAFRPPHLLGDDDGPHLFVSQFDEDTLHERDERRVVPIARDRHLEVRPRSLPRRSWLLLAVPSASGSFVPKPSFIGGT